MQYGTWDWILEQKKDIDEKIWAKEMMCLVNRVVFTLTAQFWKVYHCLEKCW